MITRCNYIDIAKGFGIILVLMGHSNVSINLSNFIYSFHMPLFFIISGYLYKKKELTYIEFVYQKFKALLIPYIIFTLIKNGFNIGALIKSIIFYGEMSWNTPIWFLITLFLVYNIYFYLDSLNTILKRFWIIVLLFIGYLCYKIGIIMIFGLQIAFIGVFLFDIGYLLKRIKIKKLKNKKIIFIILFFITLIVGVFINEGVNMVGNFYGNILYFIISSVSGSLMIIILSLIIKQNQIIEYLGKNTLIVMGVHYFMMVGLNKIISILFKVNFLESLPNDIYSVIFTAIMLIILNPVIKIINKKQLSIKEFNAKPKQVQEIKN